MTFLLCCQQFLQKFNVATPHSSPLHNRIVTHEPRCTLLWSIKMMWNAAARGDIQLLEALLARRDALVLPIDAEGSSLLHIAATHGHFPMVRFLMEIGAGTSEIRRMLIGRELFNKSA